MQDGVTAFQSLIHVLLVVLQERELLRSSFKLELKQEYEAFSAFNNAECAIAAAIFTRTLSFTMN